MNDEQARIHEDFCREMDIVRGCGGVVTTADLRAHAEQIAQAGMGPMAYFTVEDARHNAELNFAFHWNDRHDPDVGLHVRASLRKSLAELRALKGRDGGEVMSRC